MVSRLVFYEAIIAWKLETLESLNRIFLFCSHGYTPFFQAIQPQLNSLRTFLLNQSTKTVIGSNSSVSSSSNAVTSPVSAGRQLLSSVTSPLMVTTPKDVSLAQQPSGGLFTRRAMGGPGLAMASAPGTARTSPLQEQPGAQGQVGSPTYLFILHTQSSC